MLSLSEIVRVAGTVLPGIARLTIHDDETLCSDHESRLIANFDVALRPAPAQHATRKS